MPEQKKSPIECSVEQLDRELIARAKKTEENPFQFNDTEGTPERDAIMAGVKELYHGPADMDPELAHMSSWDLAKVLIFKTSSTMDFTRTAWSGQLMDYEEIPDDEINTNADCIAALCMAGSLTDLNNGFSMLEVKNYGETFNLNELEPFRRQPIAAGRLCTGFLVAENIIATAAHNVDKDNVTALRVIFGFKMLDPSTPVTRFPDEDIYHGTEIIHRVYDPANGKDWALVKLDRNVTDRTPAVLSRDKPSFAQSIYVMGHPCGLPLKVVIDGISVRDVHNTSFDANLNIYSGNSGSPVFDSNTHEVIGIVSRSKNQDFRWTGNGWLSIPNPDGKRSGCTRVSEFIDML
jgi:S1-C subfamily serine protease